MKKALIIGITGQDGAYLSELLLGKGYEVHGLVRRSSSSNTSRIDHIINNKRENEKPLFLHYGDVTDATNIIRVIQQVQPDEIYNLAAQSHVAVSFETPEYTAQADALGTLRILEAIRILGLTQKTRFYQASSSEIFGNATQIPQNEQTPFAPRSPYAAAKLYAYWITINYREAYGIFACNGILFNHESPLRGEAFVTRKITRAVAAIVSGQQEILSLGNLDARRDWGYAKEYVEAMWRMLAQDTPDDFVIATGHAHSVREFATAAFSCVGITLAWHGTGIDECGVDVATGKKLVIVDPQFFRPTDVELLMGDASKARRVLAWHPIISFHELVEIMVRHDFACVAAEQSMMPHISLSGHDRGMEYTP